MNLLFGLTVLTFNRHHDISLVGHCCSSVRRILPRTAHASMFWVTGFIPPPLDWFQFAMLYVVGLELVLLAMTSRWLDKIIEVAFWLRKQRRADEID